MACYASGYASVVDSRRTVPIHRTYAKKSNHSVSTSRIFLQNITNDPYRYISDISAHSL